MDSPRHSDDDWEHKLRRYLLLLASLAATVTYDAGIDPPGGSWVESDGEHHKAGDSILRTSNHPRYLAFYYSNASAFAASLVVILLLLVLAKNKPLDPIHLIGAWRWRLNLETAHLRVLRIVTVLDLLALMVAYTAGSCREKVATIYTVALVAALSAYVGYHILEAFGDDFKRALAARRRRSRSTRPAVKVRSPPPPPPPLPELEQLRKVLMLLFIFAATITYDAGLKPPDEPVLVFIFIVAAAHWHCIREWVSSGGIPDEPAGGAGTISPRAQTQPQQGGGHHPDDSLKAKRSLVLLLATLAASITYQAGLNPPGGVWQEYQSGHSAGDPILSNTDHKRYIIFFYCNSTAFVASVVVILMVQINSLLKRNALRFAMILDLFGLLGAYIAGSSRTVGASAHLIALAAAFLVYVTGTYLHVKSTGSSQQQPQINIDIIDAAGRRTRVKKRRKRLLLVAILMAAIPYQAGLSPPGGFWPEHYSSAGSPILEQMYPRRYKAFFYCNAMSFMASMALIILLQDDRTYQPKGIRFYGLYACMVVGMLVLMGAYAAGTARRVRTSIYVFVLVGGVIGFIGVLLTLFFREQRQQHQAAAAEASTPTPNTAPGSRQPSNAANGGGTAENSGGDDHNHHDRQSSNAANGGGDNHHL